jgi:hypothetical protein
LVSHFKGQTICSTFNPGYVWPKILNPTKNKASRQSHTTTQLNVPFQPAPTQIIVQKQTSKGSYTAKTSNFESKTLAICAIVINFVRVIHGVARTFSFIAPVHPMQTGIAQHATHYTNAI